MSPRGHSRPAVLVLTILALGSLPVLIYRFTLGSVPALRPDEAQALLKADPTVTLVDVRAPDAFGERHVPAAFNFPYSRLDALVSPDGLPARLKEKKLLLVCDSGILSAWAANKLAALGVHALHIEGGIQKWVAANLPKTRGYGSGPDQPGNAGESSLSMANTFRVSPWYEQLTAVFSGFTLKPLYMLLSLVLAYVLRKRPEADLAALRWAMLSFFAGEFFCYANFFVYGDGSYFFEYLHSYGMVLAFAFGMFAVFEGLDARLLFLSDTQRKCAAASLCRPCAKYAETFCKLRRVFHILIPACIVLALLPPAAQPSSVSYNTLIWRQPYNYSHPVVHQLYEIWFCPAAAIVLFAASWLALSFKKNDAIPWSKVWFSAGLGFFLFAYLRLVIFAPFHENQVWFIFWEEMTEFLGLVTTALVLWIFRKSLLVCL